MEAINRPSYMDKIEKYLGKETIIVLVGQRRVGKSYIMKMVREKKMKDAGKLDELNREEMCQLLESEIVVRYWFQAAAVELRLRYDTELKEALSSPLI